MGKALDVNSRLFIEFLEGTPVCAVPVPLLRIQKDKKV
jgi:hypothetical protein